MTDEREPLAISVEADEDTPPADALVDRARESVGETVIQLRRIGATPYLRYTPYDNNRGVTVGMWSCISVALSAMPGRTLLARERIVDPSESDDYPLRMFTTPWVRMEARQSHVVRLYDADETPFAGDMLRWKR